MAAVPLDEFGVEDYPLASRGSVRDLRNQQPGQLSADLLHRLMNAGQWRVGALGAWQIVKANLIWPSAQNGRTLPPAAPELGREAPVKWLERWDR
jgi:hypothetical protein